MADTRVQLEVANWIRQEWLSKKYDQPFRRDRLNLTAGGVFDFNAVSADNTIVAIISTSSGVTSGGENPAAKLQKLRADMLFLLMVQSAHRLIVLTEKDMYDVCLREKQGGRVPPEIEFVLAELPEGLALQLKQAKAIAAREVSPRLGLIPDGNPGPE